MVEFGVVDHIKSFGKINYLAQSVEWRTWLIKALSYFMCRRAVMMEWLGRNSCWLGEIGSELSPGS